MKLRALKIENLQMAYSTPQGDLTAVDKVDFEINEGETFGLAGESACGKTSTALCITRLIPPNGRIVNGRILFDDVDLLKIDDKSLRDKYRWKRISIVFQGAMNSLNPVIRIGDQIAEAITKHESTSRNEALNRSKNLLDLVGIEPKRAFEYPHELSGGQRQRAMIAMALACTPDFLIADEPTTALDVIVQAQILRLLKSLQEKLDLSMLIITHDLSVIAASCDTLAVMYAGKIVEYGDVFSIFEGPAHPYTQRLISAFPSVRGEKKLLEAIGGKPPILVDPPTGCRFHPRCPFVKAICRKEDPKMVAINKKHYASCHLLT